MNRIAKRAKVIVAVETTIERYGRQNIEIIANGTRNLLFARPKGWKGGVTGVDISPTAVRVFAEYGIKAIRIAP